MNTRRNRYVAFLSLATMLGIVGLYCAASGELRNRRARRLLVLLQTHPQPEVRAELVQLIDRHRVDAKIGSDILEALVAPRLRVRPRYIRGRRVFVAVESGELRFKKLVLERTFIIIAGTNHLNHFESRMAWQESRNFFQFKRALRPDGTIADVTESGLYNGRIDARYTLRPRTSSKVLYAYSAKLDVEFRVEDAPGDVEVVANPDLDERVRNCFVLIPGRRLPAPPSGGSIPTGISWDEENVQPGYRRPETCILEELAISFNELPVDVAFRTIFRESDGTEHFSRTFAMACEAGDSGLVSISSVRDVFGALAPGNYQGDWVMFADSGVAYPNPFITHIWSGQISFPIEFTVVQSKR